MKVVPAWKGGGLAEPLEAAPQEAAPCLCPGLLFHFLSCVVTKGPYSPFKLGSSQVKLYSFSHAATANTVVTEHLIQKHVCGFVLTKVLVLCDRVSLDIPGWPQSLQCWGLNLECQGC